ncbi:MAG: response regulator [Limisphaerales bacterium]
MPDSAFPPNHRILVIDDNRAIHQDFRKILCGRGEHKGVEQAEAALFGEETNTPAPETFEVESAYQGQEGLAALRRAIEASRPFALAFVDVRMPPGWDGIETAGHLWEADPDIEIILCTAYSDYSWDEMAKRTGASDRLVILKKPFDVLEVLQLAGAMTEKWRLARESKSRMEDLERVTRQRTDAINAANAEIADIAARLESLDQTQSFANPQDLREALRRELARLQDEIREGVKTCAPPP